MQLSSIRRLRAHCSGLASTLITNDVNEDRVFHSWLNSVTSTIEQYLQRKLEIKSRTQYFDVEPGKFNFWVDAFPIVSVENVSADPTGLWDGNEFTIDDPVITENTGRITLPYDLEMKGSKVLRVQYTGGLAYHAVNSVINLSEVPTSPWIAGSFIIGENTGAVGIITGQVNGSLSIEQYYGQFEDDEVIAMSSDETFPASPSVTGTISSFETESLLNKDLNVVTACEIQARYMRQHQMDFENNGTTKDGVTIRRGNPTTYRLPLTQEAIDALTGYERTW